MDSVAAALAAVREGRFEQLGQMLSRDIDWRGLADEDGFVPSCHGRAAALENMRRGKVAAGEVSVSALVEYGERVLARVKRVGDGSAPNEWFVLAEVHDGQITKLQGFGTEQAARAALQG